MYRNTEKNLFDKFLPFRYKSRHRYSFNRYFINDFKAFFSSFKTGAVFSSRLQAREKRRSRTGPGLGVREGSILQVYR